MFINTSYTRFTSSRSFESQLSTSEVNWDDFKSTAHEVLNGPKMADFTIDNRTWLQTCQKILLVSLKLIIFPWIIFEALRFGAHRLLMNVVYPAQSWLFKNYLNTDFLTINLDSLRAAEVTRMSEKGYVVKHVRLDKDGIAYSGLVVGKPEHLLKGKWVLQATGNGFPIEGAFRFAEGYQNIGYNLLLINGPGVGRSEGLATTQNLWEAQDIGLSFLEEAIHAKRIVAAGFSLGGAVIGQALTKHACKTNKIQYLAIAQMSFDRLSNVGRKMMKASSPCLYNFFRILAKLGDVELDSVETAKKMSQMNIPQAIIQAGMGLDHFQHDQIIPAKATLGRRLYKENILENKSFYFVPDGRHNDIPFEPTNLAIQEWENQLTSLAQ